MILLYDVHSLPKLDLMPYFLNEFKINDDIALHYYILQYLCSLLNCKDIFTRYHNLSEFFKHGGLNLLNSIMIKSLIESVGESPNFDEPLKNFSKVKIKRLATNKTILKNNILMVCIYLMANVKLFESSKKEDHLSNLKKFPQNNSVLFFAKPEVINLFLQLLLVKDDLVVRAALEFITTIYKKRSLLKIIANADTFYERVIYSGKKKGLAVHATNLLCFFVQKMTRKAPIFNEELKDMERLFPNYVIHLLANSNANDTKFLVEFEEKINTELYWTQEMFDELEDTVNLSIAPDIHHVHDY